MPTNPAPFPIQPELTAIAIAYRNAAMIGDLVLPRVPVNTQQFKYLKHTLADTFTLPPTQVGRKGKPVEVDFTATETTDQTVNHALDDPIPQDDIDNAPPNFRPVDRGVEGLTDLMILAREKRVADLVFTAANYPSANKVTLSGNDQWSVSHADSDPIADIETALDAPAMRPNIAVFGHQVWSKLRRHELIVKAILGPNASDGMVTRQQFAELFELEEVLVGQSRLNTAKKGQTASLSRVWGKNAAFLYRDKLATTSGGRTSFGYTAEWRSRMAGADADKSIGAFGGQRVRVVESVKELIAASDLGYLITDAVA